MPNLVVTLTVPQAARAASALAFLNNGQPATLTQIQEWLMAQLRQTCLTAARDVADVATVATLTQEGW